MAVVGVAVAQVGVGESPKLRIGRHSFGVPNRKSGILLMVWMKREIAGPTRKVLIPLQPQHKDPYRHQ